MYIYIVINSTHTLKLSTMNKLTLKNCPQLMDVIINIQIMKEKINSSYDKFADFKKLEKLTDDQLHELQNTLIPEYNNTFSK